MKVKIRRSIKNNIWGFVEEWKPYQYIDCGSVTVTVGVSTQGKVVVPYVLRADEFIPAKQIDEEMGIEKYIKAKKPFYCNLADGFIAQIKVGLNFETGELLRDSTYFNVYQIANKEMENANTGVLHLTRIINIPDQVEVLLYKIAEEIASFKGDRVAFLRSRM